MEAPWMLCPAGQSRSQLLALVPLAMATMVVAAAAEVSLEFMTGNPQLGLLSGRLTYYLNIDTDADNNTRASPTNPFHQNNDYRTHQLNINNDDNPTNPFNAGSEFPERRSTLLCILSVPAHMIPTDMLQFVAPMMKHVHSVRIVRPCNPTGPTDPERTPAEYMVLLQMESQVCIYIATSTLPGAVVVNTGEVSVSLLPHQVSLDVVFLISPH